MRGVLSIALVLGIVGLVAGYFLFGKVAGSYVEIQALIFPSESVFKQLGNAIRGVEEIRRKILITGGAGLVVGVVIGMVRNR